MSNKAQKRGLVPKLRFPAFRDAGEWEADELGTVAVFVNEKIPVEQVALENYVSTENILQDFGGVARASKLPTMGAVTRFRHLDTLVSNIRPYLKKVWVADKEGGASNDVIVIRAKQRLLPQYFSFLLKNDTFIDYVMTGAKGVKMPRGDIGSMKAYPALYPTKPEQQKIADCLASLDERITLEAQKLDTLKIHKKGLMQQIFPAEGETLPKLRFPEFREAGEWVIDPFDQLVEVIDGDRGINYPSAEEFSSSGYCLFLNAKNVTKNGFRFEAMQFITKEKDCVLRKGRLNRADVVLTTRGSVGQFAYFSKEVPFENIRINSGMVVLRIKTKKVNSDYLSAFCKSERLGAYIANIAFGNAQQQLTVAEIKKFQLYYPGPNEQQKIVECLSSLDDLITAQTQKLAALKTHKKGLMQQLFPVQDEVDV